jgi:hypothetical protein
LSPAGGRNSMTGAPGKPGRGGRQRKEEDGGAGNL